MANTNSLDLELSSSQFAQIIDSAQTGLNFAGDFTIEAWVKFESVPTSGNVMEFVAKWEDSEWAYHFYYYNNAGTPGLYCNFRDGSNNDTGGHYNVTLSAGTWYHVAVAVDVSVPSMNFYIDTVEHAATMDSTAAVSVRNDTKPFAIGCRQAGLSPASFFDGKIDEVRVWDDIRTGTEIANNYQTELVGNEANLVGYWKLNGDYLDATANNNDLTASGSPTFSSDVPFGTTFVPKVMIF